MAEEPTNQPEEQPVLETPAEGTEPSAEEQANALLAELKGFGVESPEDLRGMANASKEAGHAGRLLGDARDEIAELTRKIDILTATQPAPPQPATDEYGNPTIDVTQFAKKDDIKDVLRNFYRDEIIAPQQRVQQEVMGQLAEIQQDDDFQMLQPVWEKHMTNPNVQVALQSGRANIKDEYNKVVKTFYRQSLKKSKNVLEKFTSGDISAPHMEGGGPQANLQPSVDVQKQEKLKSMTRADKGWTGSEDQLVNLVNEMLPPDDPIFQ